MLMPKHKINYIGIIRRCIISFFVLLLSNRVMLSYAQTDGHVVAKVSVLDTIPEDAKALFNSYVRKPDVKADSIFKKYTQDKFIKRISFHTNAVDWAMLIPNLGLEVDIKDTPRNNYSVALFGKFNGRSKMDT